LGAVETENDVKKTFNVGVFCPFCGGHDCTVTLSVDDDGVTPIFDGGDYYEGYSFTCKICVETFTVPSYDIEKDITR
jgi:hypothetical protein